MAKMQRSKESFQISYDDGTVSRKEEETIITSSPYRQEVTEMLAQTRKPEETTLVVLCKNQQTLLKRLLQTLKSYLKDPHSPPPRPGYTQRKIMTDIIEQIQTSIEEQKRYVLSVERDLQIVRHQKMMKEIVAENTLFRRLIDQLRTEKGQAEEQIKNLRNELQLRKEISTSKVIQTSISDKNKEVSVKVSQSSIAGLDDNQVSSNSLKPVGLPEVINLIKENNELKIMLKEKDSGRSQTAQNLNIAVDHDQSGKPLKVAYQIGPPIVIDKSQSRINDQIYITEDYGGVQRVVSKQKLDMVYSSHGNTLGKSLANEKKRLEENLKDCKREMEMVKSSYDSLQKEMKSKQRYYNELKVTLRLQDEEIRKLQREIQEFREKLAQVQQSQDENNQLPVCGQENTLRISTEFNEFTDHDDWRRESDTKLHQRDSWNVVHYRGSFEEDN